jgi:hypothetical protein
MWFIHVRDRSFEIADFILPPCLLQTDYGCDAETT